MKEIVNQHITPPGSFVFTDSRTGIKHKDLALNAIYSKVATSWNANGIEFPPTWQNVIMAEMCEQNSNLECREAGEPERRLTLEDVRRFGSTVKEWLAQGGKFVDKQEAERRAAICIKCHENRPIGICWGCHDALRWIGERVGWPQTSVDSQLQGCAVCGCLLRLKTQMPLGVIDNGTANFPSHCWQHESNVQPTV